LSALVELQATPEYCRADLDSWSPALAAFDPRMDGLDCRTPRGVRRERYAGTAKKSRVRQARRFMTAPTLERRLLGSKKSFGVSRSIWPICSSVTPSAPATGRTSDRVQEVPLRRDLRLDLGVRNQSLKQLSRLRQDTFRLASSFRTGLATVCSTRLIEGSRKSEPKRSNGQESQPGPPPPPPPPGLSEATRCSRVRAVARSQGRRAAGRSLLLST